MNYAQMAELIEMPFWNELVWAEGTMYLMESRSSTGGAILRRYDVPARYNVPLDEYIAHCWRAQRLQWRSTFTTMKDDKTCKVNLDYYISRCVAAMWQFAKLLWTRVRIITVGLSYLASC